MTSTRLAPSAAAHPARRPGGRSASRLAWSLFGVAVLLEVALVGMGIAARESNLGGIASTAVGLLVFGVFATVGAIVASHRPENPIGWLFCGASICMLLANVSGGYVDLAASRGLPGPVAAAVAGSWTWIVGVALLVPLVLVFPDGRLLARGRRFVKPFIVVWLVAVAAGSIVTPGRLYPAKPPLPAADNPLAVPALSTALHAIGVVGGIVLISLCVVSLAVRWRHAGDERKQVSWFLASVVVVVAAILLSSAVHIPNTLWFPVWATIPVATGVAVLRYRLYEIDVIVRRTLVYGVLSALLFGCYFAVVLVLQATFGSVTQGNELAVAGSTLAVAALFRPARRRIQQAVDRRFYRGRADFEAALARFSAGLRREADLDALGAELHAVVSETPRPARVSLWLRADGAGGAPAVRNDPETVPT